MIAFNLPNWITIILMAALGYVALAAIAQVFQSRSAGLAVGASQTSGGF